MREISWYGVSADIILGFTAWLHMVTKLLLLNFGQEALGASQYFPVQDIAKKKKIIMKETKTNCAGFADSHNRVYFFNVSLLLLCNPSWNNSLITLLFLVPPQEGGNASLQSFMLLNANQCLTVVFNKHAYFLHTSFMRNKKRIFFSVKNGK